MMVLRSWLVVLGLVCGAAQSILSTKDKVKESRIIVMLDDERSFSFPKGGPKAKSHQVIISYK